jgi:excisionase family DNA binding protein
MEKNSSRLLTPKNVADILSISRSTVLRLIADGALVAVSIRRGKKKAVYRVRQEILDKWILSREKKQPIGVAASPFQ